MNSAQIEVIREDFGPVIDLALTLNRPESGVTIHQQEDGLVSLSSNRTGPVSIYPDNLAWYYGEVRSPHDRMGKPEDYLVIRDDAKALENFLATILDKGRQELGHFGGLSGREPGEVNFSAYPIWLYRHSQNPQFRRNFENATSQLLAAELGRTPIPFPIKEARASAEGNLYRRNQAVAKSISEDRERYEWYEDYQATMPLDETLIRYGLSLTPADPNEAEFKRLLVAQWEALKTVGKWRGGEGIEVANLRRASDQFQATSAARALEEEARRIATWKFTPKLNRLMGLFDIFEQCATPESDFAESFGLLRAKGSDGLYTEALPLQYDYDTEDVYTHLLIALSKVQPEAELRDFWMERFSEENLGSRVLASVDGLRLAFTDRVNREAQIPELLDRFRARNYAYTMTDYNMHTGFIINDYAFHQVLEGITNLCS